MTTRPTFDARRPADAVLHATRLDELGALVRTDRAALAARGQAALRLPPLALTVDGAAVTLDGARGSVTVSPGVTDGAVCLTLTGTLLDDLVSERRTILGLLVSGDVQVPHAQFDAAICWDHVLRALLYGAPVHEPGSVDFVDRHGAPLDLGRIFTPGDDDADVAHFLHQTGFLHLRGWTDPALASQIGDDVDRAAAASTVDDPHRWWAKLDGGERVCVRVQHFLDESPAMRELVYGSAYERLRRLSPDGHVRTPESPAGIEALRKLPGVTEGLADFPWHRDCSTGGHPYHCRGIAVGFAAGAATPRSGQLSVLAGSHRSGVPSTRPGTPGIDLPIVTFETEPGDLTVHLSCVLHMTTPPRTERRTVVYATFSLPDGSGASRAVDPAYAVAASIGRD